MVTLRGLLVLLTVFGVNAAEDYGQLQREVTYSPDFFRSIVEQKEVVPDPEVLKDAREVWEAPPMFGPRSRRPEIPFPLARPSRSNIQAICQYGSSRPRYPKETLPSSGFGYLHRQAKAINHLESLFSMCCSHWTEDEDLRLCCAQQAWTKSLSDFCNEEFSIKTRHFHCCKNEDLARWDCFEKAAPDTFYQSLGQVPRGLTSKSQDFDFDFDFDFVFTPSACQNKSLDDFAPKAQRGTPPETAKINFPPGRPNSANIESICTNHKQRPRYLSKCLPQKGYSWLARQLKAVNNLEKGFNQCCKEKKAQQTCAERKWKKMVDKFCKDEKKVKVKQFHCCEKGKGEEQYKCFAAAAPNPDYFHNTSQFSLSHPTLHMLCDTFTTLQGMKNVPFPVDKMAEQCCLLGTEKRPGCIQTELDILLDDLCKPDIGTSGQIRPNCCKANAKSQTKCVKQLLRSITKANKVNLSNNRKLCPISS